MKTRPYLLKAVCFAFVFLQGLLLELSLVTRKPVFGICDQVRLKPTCSATEPSKSLEISAISSRSMKLSKQMRRLICAFVVRIWHKPVFSRRGSDFQEF